MCRLSIVLVCLVEFVLVLFVCVSVGCTYQPLPEDGEDGEHAGGIRREEAEPHGGLGGKPRGRVPVVIASEGR